MYDNFFEIIGVAKIPWAIPRSGPDGIVTISSFDIFNLGAWNKGDI